MKNSKNIYLSYILDESTPSYGNRNKFTMAKKSAIVKGDVANDTSIDTTVHIGTHLDMPYHFYEDGQDIRSFTIDFFEFSNVLFIELEPKNLIVKDELIGKLSEIKNKNKYDILIVKTGICEIRDKREFWERNFGFDPYIYEYLKKNFPNIRVFGFDSISVSGFQNRMIGREAHKKFLNPKSPILLLEDMDLTCISKETVFERILIAPLRIAKCDGLPCTVIAKIRR